MAHKRYQISKQACNPLPHGWIDNGALISFVLMCIWGNKKFICCMHYRFNYEMGIIVWDINVIDFSTPGCGYVPSLLFELI